MRICLMWIINGIAPEMFSRVARYSPHQPSNVTSPNLPTQTFRRAQIVFECEIGYASEFQLRSNDFLVLSLLNEKGKDPLFPSAVRTIFETISSSQEIRFEFLFLLAFIFLAGKRAQLNDEGEKTFIRNEGRN